jgi:beta-lactam-binding protein with PASTA domain
VPRGSKVRLNLSKGSGSGVAPPPPPPPAPAGGSVPDLTGEVQSAAQRELNADGFKALVVYVSSDQPAGLVVSQAPSGGATARRGTRIRLDASLGPTPGVRKGIPKVIGLDPQAAAERLSSAGFRVQRLTQSTTVSSQDGLIVDVQPGGSNRVPVGSTVTIYVGRLSG